MDFIKWNLSGNYTHRWRDTASVSRRKRVRITYFLRRRLLMQFHEIIYLHMDYLVLKESLIPTDGDKVAFAIAVNTCSFLA